MNYFLRYRENEFICRQKAVIDFMHRWRWLAEAEMWAHKLPIESSDNLQSSIFQRPATKQDDKHQT